MHDGLKNELLSWINTNSRWINSTPKFIFRKFYVILLFYFAFFMNENVVAVDGAILTVVLFHIFCFVLGQNSSFFSRPLFISQVVSVSIFLHSISSPLKSIGSRCAYVSSPAFLLLATWRQKSFGRNHSSHVWMAPMQFLACAAAKCEVETLSRTEKKTNVFKSTDDFAVVSFCFRHLTKCIPFILWIFLMTIKQCCWLKNRTEILNFIVD